MTVFALRESANRSGDLLLKMQLSGAETTVDEEKIGIIIRMAQIDQLEDGCICKSTI